MMCSIKDFFSKCDQIRSFLRIWSNLLKKSFMENFISDAVSVFDINGLVIDHLTKYNSKGGKCMRVPCKLTLIYLVNLL